MITLKKISSLKPRVQVRKCGAAMHLAYMGTVYDKDYTEGLLEILLSSPLVSDEDGEYFRRAFASFLAGSALSGEDIYYRCLKILGEESADWDAVDEELKLDQTKRDVFPRRLLLDRVRSPYNIGAIFRSAESFGVEHIYLYECGDVSSPRAMRTSRGAVDVIPHTIISSPKEVPGPFFALETGGTLIKDFTFPFDGPCIIGSEESGVSPECLALAGKDRVTIPLYGAKGSINVSVATGILLYEWSQEPFPLS